jgi:cytochrome P450
MEELRPSIERVVEDCLDRVAAKGEMDVVQDLAFLVPLRVICGMLGIPEANHAELLEWTPDFFRVFLPEAQDAEGVAACHQASGNFIRVLSGLIEERRRDPRDDLLSALIAVEEGGDRLTRDELVATVLSLLTGGFDTTMGLISGGIQLLLRQRDVLERLRAEPALVDAAVEEFLRLESPVQTTLRYPGIDVEVAGETIRAGERLWLVVASANRDERVFPDPERVLLEGRAEHIAFGGGRHFCIGAHLARIEGTVAIRRFVERIRDPEPIEADPPRRPQLQFRALSRLPIRFRA